MHSIHWLSILAQHSSTNITAADECIGHRSLTCCAGSVAVRPALLPALPSSVFPPLSTALPPFSISLIYSAWVGIRAQLPPSPISVILNFQPIQFLFRPTFSSPQRDTLKRLKCMKVISLYKSAALAGMDTVQPEHQSVILTSDNCSSEYFRIRVASTHFPPFSGM